MASPVLRSSCYERTIVLSFFPLPACIGRSAAEPGAGRQRAVISLRPSFVAVGGVGCPSGDSSRHWPRLDPMRQAVQQTPLVIGETEPLALQMLAKQPILLLKVLDDVLLLTIPPSCQRHHQNPPRMSYHKGDSTVSKCRETSPIHSLGLSCKPFLRQDLPCG
jgi:hypothetical protein